MPSKGRRSWWQQMYDADTAELIRSTPSLEGLDRERLPEELSKAFAQIAAARFRLRSGALEDDHEIVALISEMQRLAITNEVLVAVSPSRDDRAAAAFVAGSAHQLCFNARRIGAEDKVTATYVDANSISSDIAAMLLFLVAEATADASEIADRLDLEGMHRVERSLVEALRSLARGQLVAITSATLPPKDLVTGASAAEVAALALYYNILLGVRALANQLLRGDEDIEGAHANKIFNSILNLSSAASSEDKGWLGEEIGSFAGPHHLASLLLAVAGDLSGSAVTGVAPPSGIDGEKWLNAMRRIARRRPYLWRNHREAVAKGYLDPQNSAAVSFPTGAGKSTLAELKIYATLLSDKKVVFLAPTNALVAQTTISLRKTFKRTKVEKERFDEVGFLSDEDELPEIFVMTPESCLAQMSIEPAVFEDVGLLIFDECHLLHPEEGRGRRALDAMLCVLNFAGLVPGASFLLLSAMMKNTDEIAGWIEDLTERPCLPLALPWKPTRQLRGSVVYPQADVDNLARGLAKAARARKTKAPSTGDKARLQCVPMGLFGLQQTWATRNTEDYALLGLMEDAVELSANKWWRLTPNSGVVSAAIASAAADAGVKTLVFFQTIQNAVSAKNKIIDELGEVSIKLTDEEREWLAISKLEMGGIDHLYLDVKKGELSSPCVVHHGLLLPEERQLCESLYQRADGATVMAATSTVSQGMNFPSELVVIAEDSRFDEAKDRREILQAQELLNAAGRAGRAGQNANGIVLVIPGKVVGIDIEDAKIGAHWTKLQKVFGQSDQCLEIDDPLTAVLDRVHAAAGDRNNIDRYVIARLASVSLDGAVKKSLSGFRAKKRGDADWVKSRLTAATDFQKKEKPETDEDLVGHQVASTLGIAHPVMKQLSKDLVGAPVNETVTDWRKWFFHWIAANGELFDQVFRPETIDDLFGKDVTSLNTSEERCAFAVPYLKELTRLWVRGKPLTDLEEALGTPADKLKTCIGARKFVLRAIPELGYLFGVPALLTQRLAASDGKELSLSPALTKLSSCIRNGYQTYEQAALGFRLRRDKLSRRQLHKRFKVLAPYIPPAKKAESWDDAVARIELALLAEEIS
ncbi:DEAD/DEAH box helicase [Rhizobium rhizophilum]|uniref:DEAD/DEAH box helicase n=2 Tax=Rhizobium rhizophilum TaxID=1850373 RepID=A0ABY2QST1_9HYPH|nr:DEAD/DEAH box helicase [Rhizobium rhizophilum]